MRRGHICRAAVGVAALAATVVATGPAYASLTTSNAHTRSAATPTAMAYVVSGDCPCGGPGGGPRPESTYPTGGTSTLAGIDSAKFSTTATLTATTAGNNAAGTASAAATVPDLVVRPGEGVLTLTGVSATCEASPSGNSGQGGVMSGTLKINGTTVALPTSTPPNTPFTYSVGGTSITAILNEQFTDSAGVLHVDALDVTSVDGYPSSLVVGHAQCSGAPVVQPVPMVNPAVGAGAAAMVLGGGVAFARRRKSRDGLSGE